MFGPLVKAITNTVEERQPRRFRIPAQIVSLNGSTSPSNRPNWTFVRLDLFAESTVYTAFNDTTLKVEGMWVEVEVSIDDAVYARVIGTHTASVSPNSTESTSRYSTPDHGENHQYPDEISPGPDPALIYQPAIQMLKTVGNGTSLVVSVHPLVYSVNGTRRAFPGQAVDLASYVPTDPTRVRMALIYLDKPTNTATVSAGMEAIDNGVAPIHFPTRPANGIASAYIRLATGQAVVTMSTDYLDARSFFADEGSAIQNTATQVGQILISYNGVTFEPALPMVDNDGGIMTNEDGTILTS
jgi:hypothetical protein